MESSRPNKMDKDRMSYCRRTGIRPGCESVLARDRTRVAAAVVGSGPEMEQTGALALYSSAEVARETRTQRVYKYVGTDGAKATYQSPRSACP